MSTATDRPTISAQQYHALQAPVVLPTPEELFSWQVDGLQHKGLDLPAADVDRLRALIPSDPQLFLVVPRQPGTLDLDALMALIEVNGKAGKNYLDRQHLSDVVETPKTAHLLLNIEDGRKRLNTKPSVSFENIRREERVAYPTWYGLIHAIVFPCVLQNHNLDLVGSRYRSDYVPRLYLYDGVPRLSNYWGVDAYPRWGAPSAGSVVGI